MTDGRAALFPRRQPLPVSKPMNDLPEYVGSLPNLCGAEARVAAAVRDARAQPVFSSVNRIDFGRLRSAFAIALHMHQPLIPAGGPDLSTAAIISNLKHMLDNPGVGDNHNAPVFHWCYKRMGQFIPQLVDEGHSPRVMLEYSGTLLHGLRRRQQKYGMVTMCIGTGMGAAGIFEAL